MVLGVGYDQCVPKLTEHHTFILVFHSICKTVHFYAQNAFAAEVLSRTPL